MIEQYLSVGRTANLLIPCVFEAPLWRYLLYKTQQNVFGDVTYDPSVPSEAFSASAVIIDGIEYDRQQSLKAARTNPRTWIQ
jgi:hypothetical protein